MAMPKRLPEPKLIAAVMCEKAIQEVQTNSWTLVGLFNCIQNPGVPFTIPDLALYFCISDAEGTYPVEVQLVRFGDEPVVIGRAKGTVESRDRLGDGEVVLSLRSIPFEKYGKYAFQLVMDGRVIGEKVFRVEEMRSA